MRLFAGSIPLEVGVSRMKLSGATCPASERRAA
jgi:hypothetical protein